MSNMTEEEKKRIDKKIISNMGPNPRPLRFNPAALRGYFARFKNRKTLALKQRIFELEEHLEGTEALRQAQVEHLTMRLNAALDKIRKLEKEDGES
jgi:hypothetical protein